MDQRPFCQSRDACQAKKPTTHCRRCSVVRFNLDPELKERRKLAIRAKFDDPTYKAEHRERALKNWGIGSEDRRERLREHGRKQYREVLSRPDVIAKHQAPEVRARAGKKRTASTLAWCPLEYRVAYKSLVRKGLKAADARAAIEDQIKTDLRRYLATGKLQVAA